MVKKKKQLAQFLCQCEDISNLIHQSKKEFFKLIKATKISGKAFDYIKTVDITTWDDAKTHIKIFCNSSKNLDWQTRLLQEKQKCSESVSEFGNPLLVLYDETMSEALADLDDDHLEIVKSANQPFVIGCFQRGIQDNRIRNALISSPASTLAEIITTCQTRENNVLSDQTLTQGIKDFISSKFCNHCNRNNHNTETCRFMSSHAPNHQNSP